MRKIQTRAESERDWNAIAAAVLRGEYRRATGSEKEAICIGLRGVATKECLRALAVLQPEEKAK